MFRILLIALTFSLAACTLLGQDASSATLKGNVNGANDIGLTQVYLYELKSGWTLLDSQSVDSAGHFEFHSMNAGTYIVVATHPAGLSARSTPYLFELGNRENYMQLSLRNPGQWSAADSLLGSAILPRGRRLARPTTAEMRSTGLVGAWISPKSDLRLPRYHIQGVVIQEDGRIRELSVLQGSGAIDYPATHSPYLPDQLQVDSMTGIWYDRHGFSMSYLTPLAYRLLDSNSMTITLSGNADTLVRLDPDTLALPTPTGSAFSSDTAHSNRMGYYLSMQADSLAYHSPMIYCAYDSLASRWELHLQAYMRHLILSASGISSAPGSYTEQSVLFFEWFRLVEDMGFASRRPENDSLFHIQLRIDQIGTQYCDAFLQYDWHSSEDTSISFGAGSIQIHAPRFPWDSSKAMPTTRNDTLPLYSDDFVY